jgi:hypothetical protein
MGCAPSTRGQDQRQRLRDLRGLPPYLRAPQIRRLSPRVERLSRARQAGPSQHSASLRTEVELGSRSHSLRCVSSPKDRKAVRPHRAAQERPLPGECGATHEGQSAEHPSGHVALIVPREYGSRTRLRRPRPSALIDRSSGRACHDGAYWLRRRDAVEIMIMPEITGSYAGTK